VFWCGRGVVVVAKTHEEEEKKRRRNNLLCISIRGEQPLMYLYYILKLIINLIKKYNSTLSSY
jgi:hypothetical protein